ncbi:MAG: HAMP domain-containing protein [Chloroflexi bacterium]|nr:HAMP domain-containing protein [Chloroflexota bacterium]
MPIRVRLALWHGAIFGAALLVFGVALYAIMARHLASMADEGVAGRVEHLATALRAANADGRMSNTLVIPPLDTFEEAEVYVQVLAPDGAVLSRSGNLKEQSLPIPQGAPRQGEFSAVLGGVEVRGSVAPVAIGGSTAAWVQVAVSNRQREMVLQRLRWALIGGGAGAVALVGLLSGALAGRALAPVSEMAETARAIALSRGFDRRLKAGNPRDELGQLALTFNEMLASLEKAYAAQEQFAAHASHELRAPLTGIRGNLDLMGMIKDMPEEERQQVLGQVRREVERLSRLVNDLLALARADTGQELELRPVELDAVVVDVYRQVLPTANGLDLRLATLEPSVVQGDEDRLKEVLLILVDNAIRYTPQGGTVTLALRREPPWVSVDVEDTGMGIAPEHLPHIFQRFWRADPARSRDRGGTGLGLAIAKGIVDQHGGEILVASTPGRGSRFTVRLPAHG